MKRKRMGLSCLAPVLVVALAVVCSSAGAAENGPIKVGFLVSYTGIAPMQAKNVTEGAELAFDEAGGKAGGREIQVFKEDTEFNPTVALTKVKRLVEENKVNFVVGPISSGVALAIHDYISKQNVVLIVPCAFTRELTSPDKARPNIFRTVETTDQGNYPMGKWMIDNTKFRKVVVAGQDYKAGHDSLDAFKAGFEAAGGKVVKEVYAPIGTMDFASFLAAMDVKDADALYVFFAGTDAVRFIQQYDEFGLKKRLPLFGYTAIADDPYLDSMGDAAVGTISSTAYTASLETGTNASFVKAYKAKYGRLPSHYSEYGYVAGKMILAAVEAVKGDVGDSAKVAAEMKRVSDKIEAPSGPLAFDKYNQRIVNEYVEKTEKKDGKLSNVVIGKIGKVAQEDVWQWWHK